LPQSPPSRYELPRACRVAAKTVARIFRFERAVSLLAGGSHSLGEVAVECGYYDQAHLNRDFREFADASPGAFAQRIVPDGGVLA
jgi:transcriptional regulator GlxA family with amidase domain